ncbi:MAG: galactokinase [Nitrospira sp.]|nr:galactokinase [Nitrospira sp.]
MTEQIRQAFTAAYGRAPEVIAFAPGRIEFIGNHTDYNGGPVLGVALDRGVWVVLAPRSDGQRRLASDYGGAGMRVVEVPFGALAKQTGPATWTNYPLGVLSVLPSFGFQVPSGFDFLAVSNLPAGSGLSSSAAIELASALAFLAATRQTCPTGLLAQIGRKAENDYVGVPCGILDQGVSAFGRADHLVYIDCHRFQFSQVRLPAQADFWVFNTHTKHALVDGLYAERHRECLQAATSLGVAILADATLGQLDATKERMPGQTEKRARHVINEITRVRETVDALAAGLMQRVGSLLTASHRSSQGLFENSTPELDMLVDTLVAMPHVLGARLTGGGFGGAVLALTGPGFDRSAATEVAALYARRFGTEPDILQLRSGDGARVLTA